MHGVPREEAADFSNVSPRHPVVHLPRGLAFQWRGTKMTEVTLSWKHFRVEPYESCRLPAHACVLWDGDAYSIAPAALDTGPSRVISLSLGVISG